MLEQLEMISLSNIEVMKLVNNKSNIIKYSYLLNINNIDEILEPYGACIILFLTGENYGHWTCIFKINNNTLEFFDPYGIYPDHELNFKMDKYFRKINNQDYPHLTFLLLDSGYNISFNEIQFQDKKKNIATCGRHVSLRLILRDLSLYEYYKMFIESNINPDTFVTIITTNILNNKY